MVIDAGGSHIRGGAPVADASGRTYLVRFDLSTFCEVNENMTLLRQGKEHISKTERVGSRSRNASVESNEQSLYRS
jgi:hypothetical protein